MPFVFPQRKRKVVRIRVKNPYYCNFVYIILSIFVIGLPLMSSFLNSKALSDLALPNDSLYYIVSRNNSLTYLK